MDPETSLWNKKRSVILVAGNNGGPVDNVVGKESVTLGGRSMGDSNKPRPYPMEIGLRGKHESYCRSVKADYTGINSIIKAYRADHQHKARQELRYFIIQRSLEDVIEIAANARMPGGRRHPHQRRIPGVVLRRFCNQLISIKRQISRSKNFHALWSTIRSIGQGIHGVGELTIYDTAHRISAYLHIPPDRVYLHAGTRVGARNLGLDVSSDILAVSAIPSSLRILQPYEIEDCLCIYKDAFRGFN